MKVETVLVPVDFSPLSILAVNYGVTLARKCRARLLLLYVSSGAGRNDRNEDAEAALSMLVGPEDQDDLNLLVLVKSGDVEREIRKVTQDNHADIVVMGTHGRRLLGRLIVGSVTEDLLRKTTVPLMTVCHSSRPPEFKQILFATDLSDSARKAFSEVVDLAQMLSASLMIVHVIGMPFTLSEENPDMSTVEIARRAHRDIAATELTRLVGIGIQESVPTESSLIEGSPAEGILQAAQDYGCDLIALAVAGRGVVDRAVFGSSAERVIREARIPVLSLHVAKQI